MITPQIRDEIIRLYLTTGETASQIARLIGHGVTRNSVLGVIHRAANKGEIKLRGQEESEAKKLDEERQRTTITGCRYILGEVYAEQRLPDGTVRLAPTESWRYCGAALGRPDDGQTPPYCPEHAARCRAKPTAPDRIAAAEITPIRTRREFSR